MQHIINATQETFFAFLDAHKEELDGREGLYLLIRDSLTGDMQGFVLGKFSSPEKLAEKSTFALSKINSFVGNLHNTTFPMQDYAQKKYGGGIRGRRYWSAVSGFPPQLDHLFLFQALQKSGELSADDIVRIQREFDINKNRGAITEQPCNMKPKELTVYSTALRKGFDIMLKGNIAKSMMDTTSGREFYTPSGVYAGTRQTLFLERLIMDEKCVLKFSTPPREKLLPKYELYVPCDTDAERYEVIKWPHNNKMLPITGILETVK